MPYKNDVFWVVVTGGNGIFISCVYINRIMVNRLRPRIDVTISPKTIAALDDLAWFGSRGRKIDEAVSFYRRAKKL